MAQTDYERRKKLEQRKKEQGLFRRQFYLNQRDLDSIERVKAELSSITDETTTNDMAMAFFIAFYNEHYKR